MSEKTSATDADPKLVGRLLAIIGKEGIIPPDKLQLDAGLDTLGVQSADVIVILLAIEEEFGVYIPVDSDLAEAKTIGDMVSALARHISAATPDQ